LKRGIELAALVAENRFSYNRLIKKAMHIVRRLYPIFSIHGQFKNKQDEQTKIKRRKR
jgi:hypothetical protein